MLRFATSLTGDMHIESLKVALLNYIIAKQKGEKFLVMIENIDGDHQEILEMLNLFGITADEVAYQNHNLRFHQQLATKLLMDKKAFNCFCTDKTLEEKYDGTCKNLPDSEVIDNENPFCVRIKSPQKPIMIADKIEGKQEFTPEEIDDFIILKVDKTPTFNFACALDDMLSDISFVVSKKTNILDSAKQIHIRNSLGYDKDIEYAHIPELLFESDTTFSVKKLLEEGFLPEAITNYLLLTGYEAPNEFFTLEEAIEWFDISKVSKTPTKFDINKLKTLNAKHIKSLDSLKLASFVGFKSKDIGELAKLYTEESTLINDIKENIETVFSKKSCKDDDCQKIKEVIKNAPHFEKFEDFKNYLKKETKLEDENLLKSLRFILTGVQGKINLSDIYPYIKNYIKEIAR